MTYYVTFSIVASVGFMGTQEEEFEVKSIDSLKKSIKHFLDTNETDENDYLIDEIIDENGNDIDWRDWNIYG